MEEQLLYNAHLFDFLLFEDAKYVEHCSEYRISRYILKEFI